jgi:hypothetical protein
MLCWLLCYGFKIYLFWPFYYVDCSIMATILLSGQFYCLNHSTLETILLALRLIILLCGLFSKGNDCYVHKTQSWWMISLCDII